MQRLINASNRTVGAKQTKKLLENGQAQVVYIAEAATAFDRLPI